VSLVGDIRLNFFSTTASSSQEEPAREYIRDFGTQENVPRNPSLRLILKADGAPQDLFIYNPEHEANPDRSIDNAQMRLIANRNSYLYQIELDQDRHPYILLRRIDIELLNELTPFE
jgi:hypothetical protein